MEEREGGKVVMMERKEKRTNMDGKKSSTIRTNIQGVRLLF